MANYALYSVIYGQEWEDMVYFTDFDKARSRFIAQSIAYIRDPFEYSLPMMDAFVDKDGELEHARMYDMNLKALQELIDDKTAEHLMSNPEKAYHVIME